MNLLLFIPSLADGKGGAERVAGELGTAMRRRGHRVAYAFDTTFNEGRPQYPVPPDAPLLTYNASFLSQVHLREKIAALGPDLILVFYANWRVKEYCHLLDGLGIPLAFQECANPNRVLADNWAHAANARRMRADILVRAAGIRFTQPRYTESLPAELRGLADAFPNAFARAEAVRTMPRGPKPFCMWAEPRPTKMPMSCLTPLRCSRPAFRTGGSSCVPRPPVNGMSVMSG